MAKFITFNGVTLYHPGGLTKIDAAGLAQVGSGVSGIVGVIGEADAGQPCTAADPKVYEFTDPSAAIEVFKTGPMADAIDFLFNPSNDVRIPGGAQKVICVKTNASTQSSVNLPLANDNSKNAITVQSVDYGVNTAGIQVKVSQNATDDDKFDVTVNDTVNGVVESFTSLGGKALMNVKYQGPPDPVVVETLTSTATDNNLLTAGAGIGNAKAGQWVRIKSGAQSFMNGQIRRITSVDAGENRITVQPAFCDAIGNDTGPTNGCVFEVIRTVIGPFYVEEGTSVSSFKLESLPSAGSHASAWAEGDPIIAIDPNTEAQYGSFENGPGYVKVVSGTGAGQIRRISSVVGDTDVTVDITVNVTPAFDTKLDTTSRISFINAVHDATSVASGHGAFGVIEGANGAASKLILSFRPGFGEDDGSGTAVALNGASAAYTAYEFSLGSAATVSSVVNSINSSSGNSNSLNATAATAHSAGAWSAQVGTGRSGLLTTDRFDFMLNGGTELTTDLTNGGVAPDHSDKVDLLCDFDQQFSKTFGASSANSVKKHRFLDNLAQLEDALDNQSLIVNATRSTSGSGDGAGMPKFNPTFAESLSGGAKGASSASTVELAFEQLIKKRHNTAVALFSSDYSSGGNTFTIDFVHSQLKSHANNGAGAHRNEVDCIAAYDASVAASTALVDTIAKANGINNRNVGLVYQKIQRPALDGSNKVFGPEMLACALAGMQAGATVGEPLTFKFVNALDIVSPVNADPQDKNDSDQLLQNSVLFCEKVQGQGFRVVRNYSTYAQDDNLAYTERHVNAELNYMAYDLRTFIEDRFTGLKATPATVANIKSAVVSKLEVYKRDLEIIVDSNDPVTGAVLNAYRNLKVTISGDIATIRFEIFPTIGINYFKFDIVAQLPTISA